MRLGDSDFPVSVGSGGQWGANNSISGVYAACAKLRKEVARKLGFNAGEAEFADGQVRAGNRAVPLADAGALPAEDGIEYGDLGKKYVQSTFTAHFVEAAVDRFTGETRIRRMLAVCAAGRILNPKAAGSQVIGAMVMGVGAELMEELAVDTERDIPHQEVVFLDETDPMSSPMKGKGVGELGLCAWAPPWPKSSTTPQASGSATTP